jgi:hypothetical protein
MRFGVGLDLWSKTPMDDHSEAPAIGSGQPPAQRKASPAASTEAKPTKAELEKRAKTAVDTMLAAKTVDDAEKMVSRAFNSPAKEVRCDGLLTPGQRETLGMTGEPHNLHDLAQTVLAYVEKHNRSVLAAEERTEEPVAS